MFMLVNINLPCYIKQISLFCCCASWVETATQILTVDTQLLASAVLKSNLFPFTSDQLIRRNEQRLNWQIQNFTQQIQNLNSGVRSSYHSEQMHGHKDRALLPLKNSHQYSQVSDTHLQSSASQWVPNRYGKSLSYIFHIPTAPRSFSSAAASDWGWKQVFIKKKSNHPKFT